MKKLLYLCFITLLCKHVSYAQGDNYYTNSEADVNYQATELLTNPTVQTPNAAAFQKVNLIPVTNDTVRTSFKVPIYIISFGNMKIPISLFYNSSVV